ncbi:phosphoenolpyruvate carboxykinase [Candidatus Bathyarchaeota archaeon RBG_13_52_12]|nr:MAG: phosphoenolpyruvate carboxykinase [Candidatus Bathyarchaeota archaeon RBG_13_52_12]
MIPGDLGKVLNKPSLENIEGLGNQHVIDQLNGFVRLCKPARVTVFGESLEDVAHVRELALERGEEVPLKMKGHTIHFDGFYDLARDVGSTKVLTPPEMRLSKNINTINRDEGLNEILGIMDGCMKGKEMLVKFYSLGPTNSRFSLCAMQVTDSSYVAHSEDLLYRQGYEQFKHLKGGKEFFTFLHSAGELDDRKVTKNTISRRIYIDVVDGKVYSANNQYAGNSVGLKKLALRLAIYKANHEDWLSEHMLLMGIHPLGKKRVTYFAGAYPSACGKTSTAMIPGQSIVGDDIAYLKEDKEGYCRGVNIEQGIFGIIQDVNPVDDPLIYKSLTTPRELIFSNILISDGIPYWLGMGRSDIPEKGTNFSGEWFKGKKDKDGNEIPFAHGNARYTMRLSELENVDPRYNDPDGVTVEGIFYGGRDSDTNVPIAEALSWEHGVYIGATLESETTTATIGKTGVRRQDLMANIDFVVVPLSTYLTNHIKFGRKLTHKPRVYATNYFLRHEGKYTNTKVDKKIWVLWAEGRVNGEYDAIKTPIGMIPLYKDLKQLFKTVFKKDYTEEEYIQQFSIRVTKYLEKIARMEQFYKDEPNMPREFWDILNQQKRELQELKIRTGKDAFPPISFV